MTEKEGSRVHTEKRIRSATLAADFEAAHWEIHHASRFRGGDIGNRRPPCGRSADRKGTRRGEFYARALSVPAAPSAGQRWGLHRNGRWPVHFNAVGPMSAQRHPGLDAEYGADVRHASVLAIVRRDASHGANRGSRIKKGVRNHGNLRILFPTSGGRGDI